MCSTDCNRKFLPSLHTRLHTGARCSPSRVPLEEGCGRTKSRFFGFDLHLINREFGREKDIGFQNNLKKTVNRSAKRVREAGSSCLRPRGLTLKRWEDARNSDIQKTTEANLPFAWRGRFNAAGCLLTVASQSSSSVCPGRTAPPPYSRNTGFDHSRLHQLNWDSCQRTPSIQDFSDIFFDILMRSRGTIP
jgi:hypothetical protein